MHGGDKNHRAKSHKLFSHPCLITTMLITKAIIAFNMTCDSFSDDKRSIFVAVGHLPDALGSTMWLSSYMLAIHVRKR